MICRVTSTTQNQHKECVQARIFHLCPAINDNGCSSFVLLLFSSSSSSFSSFSLFKMQRGTESGEVSFCLCLQLFALLLLLFSLFLLKVN